MFHNRISRITEIEIEKKAESKAVSLCLIMTLGLTQVIIEPNVMNFYQVLE